MDALFGDFVILQFEFSIVGCTRKEAIGRFKRNCCWCPPSFNFISHIISNHDLGTWRIALEIYRPVGLANDAGATSQNDQGNRHPDVKKFCCFKNFFHGLKTIPIVGCEVQHKTAKLFMWAKHRKISFNGSKNCGKFTMLRRSNFPSAPAFHTSIIRPLKRA